MRPRLVDSTAQVVSHAGSDPQWLVGDAVGDQHKGMGARPGVIDEVGAIAQGAQINSVVLHISADGCSDRRTWPEKVDQRGFGACLWFFPSTGPWRRFQRATRDIDQEPGQNQQAMTLHTSTYSHLQAADGGTTRLSYVSVS